MVAWFSLIQKFVYLDNEKRFQDEIKNHFLSFKRAFIEGNFQFSLKVRSRPEILIITPPGAVYSISLYN